VAHTRVNRIIHYTYMLSLGALTREKSNKTHPSWRMEVCGTMHDFSSVTMDKKNLFQNSQFPLCELKLNDNPTLIRQKIFDEN
jgi:hypothetical protein